MRVHRQNIIYGHNWEVQHTTGKSRSTPTTTGSTLHIAQAHVHWHQQGSTSPHITRSQIAYCTLYAYWSKYKAPFSLDAWCSRRKITLEVYSTKDKRHTSKRRDISEFWLVGTSAVMPILQDILHMYLVYILVVYDADSEAWFILWKYRCDMRQRLPIYTIMSQDQCNQWKTRIMSQCPSCDLGFPCRNACRVACHNASCRKSWAWLNSLERPVATACDSVRPRATGVSHVAMLVASHVAAIFHSITRAWASRVNRRRCMKKTTNMHILPFSSRDLEYTYSTCRKQE